MEFFEAVEKRVSVRRYRPDPVSREDLLRVLKAARRAPSWENLQCARFLVVTAPEKRKAVFDAVPEGNPAKKALRAAPAVILLCADPADSGSRGGLDYFLVDAGIAFEHLFLAAAAMGLGTCWVGVFGEADLKKAFGIPDRTRIVALTPLGYPEKESSPRPRKELSELVHFEEWGGAEKK